MKDTKDKHRSRRQDGQAARQAARKFRPSRDHKKTPFPKPGNALYPAPACMVTCRDPETSRPNIVTVGWAGNICTNPPILSISLRKSRFSYGLIRRSGEFTVNLTTPELVRACDFCGVRSGRDLDKFEETGLTPEEGVNVACPSIRESPVSIECRVRQVIELGSHDLFIGDVVTVLADEAYFDETGAFHLEAASPVAWSHGKYYALGAELGSFGYSVRKKKKKRPRTGGGL